MFKQRLCTFRVAVTYNDNRADGFYPLFVRNTNHRHLSYRLMLIEGFFHVPAGHQDAAGIHHVFNPVNDIDVALLVTVTGVAGGERTTLEGLLCGSRCLPGTDHSLWRP